MWFKKAVVEAVSDYLLYELWRTPKPEEIGDRWDLRFLLLAKHVSEWSKDPSTKVGAVIADQDNRICGVGFNGFAKGVEDSPDRLMNRELKYKMVLHAEENALAFASKTEDCTLYTWPLPPCAHCMSLAAQHSIARVVSINDVPERWFDSVQLSCDIAEEAGIEVDLIEIPDNDANRPIPS